MVAPKPPRSLLQGGTEKRKEETKRSREHENKFQVHNSAVYQRRKKASRHVDRQANRPAHKHQHKIRKKRKQGEKTRKHERRKARK